MHGSYFSWCSEERKNGRDCSSEVRSWNWTCEPLGISVITSSPILSYFWRKNLNIRGHDYLICLRFVICLIMAYFVNCVNLRLWHLSQACQREEEAQQTKMMLRFREEKIKQLEMVVHGSLSSENYLMEENKALLAEIQLLRARIDRNPELTRFALENIRLHEQLQL